MGLLYLTWLYEGHFLMSQHVCMPILYEFCPPVSVTVECTYEPHLDLRLCLQVW